VRRWGPGRRGSVPRSTAVLTDFELTTERLRLRPFRADDLDALEPILADEKMMEHYPHPFSREESQLWIERNRRRYREDGFGLWAMELLETGDLIGDCGLVVQQFPERDEVEIGWHTKCELWGQGFATEAAREVVRYAFNELQLESLISMIVDENAPSRRVAEKLGMHVDGRASHMERNHLVYRLHLHESE
jgi:RimJ/RimL family protein N-acetyltransferase